MKFVNEIIRSLRAFSRKTGALLGTTFVLSLHAVFHNVICNWCNRTVQFLSIIVLGLPFATVPRTRIQHVPVHGRPISRVLSRILWIFEQAERLCCGDVEDRACHCPLIVLVYSCDTCKLESTPRRDSILMVLESQDPGTTIVTVSSPGNSKRSAKDFVDLILSKEIAFYVGRGW